MSRKPPVIYFHFSQMAVSVIQGASRGLGLQFCKHILSSKPNSVVYATCRNPEQANNLVQLRHDYGDDRYDAINFQNSYPLTRKTN